MIAIVCHTYCEELGPLQLPLLHLLSMCIVIVATANHKKKCCGYFRHFYGIFMQLFISDCTYHGSMIACTYPKYNDALVCYESHRTLD